MKKRGIFTLALLFLLLLCLRIDGNVKAVVADGDEPRAVRQDDILIQIFTNVDITAARDKRKLLVRKFGELFAKGLNFFFKSVQFFF